MGHDCILSTHVWERITHDARRKGGVGDQLCEEGGNGNLQGMRKAEQHQD